MRRLSALALLLALAGCGGNVNSNLNSAATVTSQAAAGAATAAAAIPGLCQQVSTLILQVSQSGLTGAKLQAALDAGVAKYNSYCGPIAVDLAIAAQVAADLTAIINQIQAIVKP